MSAAACQYHAHCVAHGLPFTGDPLWIFLIGGVLLIGAGLLARRGR